MSEFAVAYIVAISAMLFAGGSALTLIYVVKHFDSVEIPAPPEEIVREKIAV